MTTTTASLLTWAVFTAFQFHNPDVADLNYYEQNFWRLAVFRIPWQTYLVLFPLTYGPLFVSVFLYFSWLLSSSISGVPLAIYILYLVMLVVDKWWFVFFFDHKNMSGTVSCAIVQLVLSTTLVVLMGVSKDQVGDLWYVPMILQLPFLLLMVHLVIISVDWSLHIPPAKKR